MNEYLRQFIIGSSLPTVVAFYISVMNIKSGVKNYSYETYTVVAPLFIGIMSMLSVLLDKKYNLGDKKRYLYTSLISATIVCIFATLTKSYNFTIQEWIFYYVTIFIRHIITYNLIIYFLNQRI